MSSRAKKLVELAQALPLNIEQHENSDNDINVSNITQVDSFPENEMYDVLTPEDIADLIEKADIVFEDNNCSVANSTIEDSSYTEKQECVNSIPSGSNESATQSGSSSKVELEEFEEFCQIFIFSVSTCTCIVLFQLRK
jgi:hypothetical protein